MSVWPCVNDMDGSGARQSERLRARARRALEGSEQPTERRAREGSEESEQQVRAIERRAREGSEERARRLERRREQEREEDAVTSRGTRIGAHKGKTEES